METHSNLNKICNLLIKGMFPDSLDYCLNFNLDFNEVEKILMETCLSDNNESEYVKFVAYKSNSNPRFFQIPHPFQYCKLVSLVKNHWKEVATNNEETLNIFSYKDGLCEDDEESAKSRLYSISHWNFYYKTEKIKNMYKNKAFGARYIAYADVGNFYNSIYTHSIPWCLVGKDEAKNHQRGENWYNQIDKYFRLMNRKQTSGIPVGPDISSFFAEILLDKVDKELEEEFIYFRQVDDYKCFCKNHAEAEKFVLALSKALGKYELKLNAQKTKITNIEEFVLPENENDHPDKILEKIEGFTAGSFGNSQIEMSIYDYILNFDETDNEKEGVDRGRTREVHKDSLSEMINLIFRKAFLNPYLLTILYFLIEKSSIKFDFPSVCERINLKNKLEIMMDDAIDKGKECVMVFILSVIRNLPNSFSQDELMKLKKMIVEKHEEIFALDSEIVNVLMYRINFEDNDYIKNKLSSEISKDCGWFLKYNIAFEQNREIKEDDFLEELRKKGVDFLKTS